MKKNLVLVLLVMFMVSCLGLLGCNKEKTTNAPAVNANQEKASSTGNELADLMKSARQTQGMSYEMINTVTTQGQTNTSKSKMWTSNKKMRMETEAMGMKSVVISNGTDIWMYNASNNTAMKMSTLEAEDQEQLANKWAADDSYLSKMKIVGEENMDGYKCLVVTVKDEETDSKMWLRKDIGMPVRMESKIAGSEVVIEYKNYKLGAQDDSLFEVPAGAQVIEMPTMPNVPQKQN